MTDAGELTDTREATGAAAPEGDAAEPVRALRRNQPLVPAESIAGRALVTVIAIMTFLAAITAGAAQLLAEASYGWTSSVAREATIQVRPAPGRDVDAEVEKAAALARATAGIASVRVFTRAESERLLEPWLGVGLNFDELPVPRIVVLEIEGGKGPDLAALRTSLTDTVKGATLDDHRIWVERLSAMAGTLVALGVAIVALVVAATALAVAFATRGAMAGNREIVEVLHFVGATDSYIAGQFQRHFLRLGLRGGLIGGSAAFVFFLLAGWLASTWVATAEGAQVEALFGTVRIGLRGLVAIFFIAILVAVVTAIVSRITVRRTLRELA